MRYFLSICAIVLSVFATTLPLEAKSSYVVSPGEKIELGWRALFDDNCKFRGLETYKVSKKPLLGKLKFNPQTVVLTSVNRTQAKKCLNKKVRGIVIYYTAGKARGKDKFSYYRTENGKNTRFTITVTIK